MTDQPTPPAPTDSSHDHRALLKQALRALEQMKHKLAAAELRATDPRSTQPIAIIGMGCRFPGGATSTDAFWDLLKSGQDAISEIPADRWKAEDYYDPDASKAGKMVSRYGGFLEDIDRFDAAFFGIAPREAAMMDPQQRLLLEVAWQALEDAAIAPASLAGSPTGMYLGMASGDYAQLQLQAGCADLLDVHYASGNAHSIASGRLSYLLGLKGPSLSIDTACSSSLVAVHLACQALRSGGCTLALAGGVNIILAPETTVALSRAHMLAPDGRCKVFDDRADGFTRAEGCGILVLKPLDRAKQDGDRILAIIRGTALNQDGASSSLTAPHGPSQEELIRRALKDAGLAADRVGYVETHGTGTALGDPIELRALSSVYGSSRSADTSLLVGSLKTNLGHMEAAAGVGGLIKLVLSLQHGEIPAHQHFETPTTHVSWPALRLAVPRTQTPWPILRSVDGVAQARVGGVSSFGFSGTNAHLVVEQGLDTSLDQLRNANNIESIQPMILPLSAKSEAALRALIEQYAGFLKAPQAAGRPWADIAMTASVGRDHFRRRLAIVASNPLQAADLLTQHLSASMPAPSTPWSVCFVFTGQGSEHSGMGLSLLERSEVFSAAVERLDKALSGILDRSIAQIWASHDGELEQARYVQPALYAYGWALSELWRSLGVAPQTVLGHSLGEYIAATVAGVITPEEAIGLVAARGRLTEELAQPGGMISVLATQDQVLNLLAQSTAASQLSIAAVNGPSSIVVSGPQPAIDSFREQLRLNGLGHKRLRTTHGFHSRALDPMLDAFEAEAGRIRYQLPELRWISNVTGNLVDRRQPVDAAYWRQHLRQTVQFAASVETANTNSPDSNEVLFLELGAQPHLLALIEASSEANAIDSTRLVASIAKSGTKEEWHKLLNAAATLYTRGVDLNWKAISQGRPFQKIQLPGYPFERQRFWFNDHPAVSHLAKPPAIPTTLFANLIQVDHPLLESRLLTQSSTVTFHAKLSLDTPPLLSEHIVLGKRILPGAAYLEMAIASANLGIRKANWQVTQVEFRSPCAFDQPRLLETLLHPATAAAPSRFVIASVPHPDASAPASLGELEWTLHATGELQEFKDLAPSQRLTPVSEIQSQLPMQLSHAAFYGRFQTSGLKFGTSFQPVQQAWGNTDQGLVEIRLDPRVTAETDRYSIHPIALDACLQAAAAIHAVTDRSAPALPASLEGFRVSGSPRELRYAHAQVLSRKGRSLAVDIRGLDTNGRELLALDSLTLVSVPEQHRARAFGGWLHEIEWHPIQLPFQVSCGNVSQLLPAGQPHTVQLNIIQIDQNIQALAQQSDVPAFTEWMRGFDRLCAAWIFLSIQSADVSLSVGAEFTSNALASQLGVAPVHRRLLNRFLKILVEFDYLRPVGEERYETLVPPSFDLAGAIADLSASDYPEFAWTSRMAPQLLSLLRGEADPLEALFANGGQAIATRLYRESIIANTFNRALAAAALEAAKQCAGGARVLEVGGGTAATTSYLIPALDGHLQSYVWTDLGSSFVHAARREFSNVSRMLFQTLDLEQDPVEQGLRLQTFDIVIASNVVHATRNLRQSLRHLRSLLRPGGLLLMVETVERQPWVDLTVGFTEGWWRFDDYKLRPEYALISRRQWLTLLADSGFSTISALPDPNNAQQPSALSQQTLLAAVAESESSNALSSERSRYFKTRLLIVRCNANSVPNTLADAVQQHAIRAGAWANIVSINQLSEQTLQAFFSPDRQPLSTRPENFNILYVVAAERTELSEFPSGQEALDWQLQVLGGALRLTQLLLASDQVAKCRLLLITKGASGNEVYSPDGATLNGFVRTVRAEYPESHVSVIDLDRSKGASPQASEEDSAALWRLCAEEGTLPAQLAMRSNTWLAPRLIPREAAAHAANRNQPANEVQPHQTRRLFTSAKGSFDHLKPSIEDRRAPADNQVEIAVTATALNFHEVLSVLHADAGHGTAPGGECSGVVQRVGAQVHDLKAGDQIVAIGSGLMSDYATIKRDCIWKKPDPMSLEAASTLLIPFLTARWCLEKIAKLRQGETVLVHAGAGGVGLAAIQVVKRLGARVIATAGSESKRQYLRSLGINNVFDSRSTQFEQDVLLATDYHGVDVVLNSLSDDKIAAGLRSLAPRGRFIELGESTVLTDQAAQAIRPDVTYHPVHLRAALAAATPEIRALLQAIVDDAQSSVIQPLPFRTFTLDQAPEAFRFMASGQHIGRVLIVAKEAARDQANAPATSFPGFRKDGAYIVTGGLTGLGKLVVEWLADQGAGCILALGRRLPDPETAANFANLRDQGTVLLSEACDVSDSSSLAQALKAIPSAYSLRGVFHAAGALADAGLPQQSLDKFREVLAAKVSGSWNLHLATLNESLDCFVLFSSGAGALGSRGQSNHAAANAYLDALAHFRKDQLGLPALSINWGAWSGTGAAVRHGVLERSQRAGVASIEPADGLRLLRLLLDSNLTQVLASPVDWNRWAEHSKAEAAANSDLLDGLPAIGNQDGPIAAAPLDEVVAEAFTPPAKGSSWQAQLVALTEAQRLPRLEALLEQRIRAVLSLPAYQPIDNKRPLQEYGLDSLLSIELRNLLSADLGQRLPATTLFDYPTQASLTRWIFRDVLKLDSNPAAPSPLTVFSAEDQALKAVATLSDEEVEKLFQSRMAGTRE